MKHLILALFILLGFYACDDALTTDIDTSISKTILIPVPADDTRKSTHGEFVSVDTISLKDDKNLEQYIDNIKDVVINGVTYDLSIDPDALVIETLTLTIENTSFTYTISNVTAATTLTELGVTTEMLAEISEYLLTNGEIIVHTSGRTNASPATITLKLDLDTTVSASVI